MIINKSDGNCTLTTRRFKTENNFVLKCMEKIKEGERKTMENVKNQY